MDQDNLQIMVFSDWGDDGKVEQKVKGQVNKFLCAYPADRIVSVIPQVTEKTFSDGTSSMRYTVTVVTRS